MKINIHNIFIGTIKQCIEYKYHNTNFSILNPNNNLLEHHISFDTIVVEKNAVLIQVCNDGYVNLNTLNSVLDELKVKKQITKPIFYSDELVLGTVPSGKHCLFVDNNSLQPYVPLEKDFTEFTNVSVKQLKKKILLDSRIPGGIDW